MWNYLVQPPLNVNKELLHIDYVVDLEQTEMAACHLGTYLTSYFSELDIFHNMGKEKTFHIFHAK